MNEAGDSHECGPDHPVDVIHTDVFCQWCGANLYGSDVWRTEGTHLLVVTCSRCGRLAPASEATPYRRIWRQRLGLTLSLCWMSLLLAGFAAFVAIEAALQVTSAEMRRQSNYYYYRSGIQPELDRGRTAEALRVTIPISLMATFAAGCLLACALYHWERPWHIAAAALSPVLATGFVALAALESEYAQSRFAVSLHVFFVVMLVQIGGGLIGVSVGRPVGRAVIRILLPNRTRRYFAFLWRRDGKELPLGPY